MTHESSTALASNIKKYTDDVAIEANARQKELALLKHTQNPYFIDIACVDSRIISSESSTNPGDGFICRSIGNHIGEKELAAIELAVYVKDAKIVILRAHDGCSAVATSMGDFSQAPTYLGKALQLIKDDYTSVQCGSIFDHLSPESQNEFKGIHAQTLKVVPHFKDVIDSGEVVFITMMHDNQGNFGKPGLDYFYAVNGNSDLEFVRNHPAMAELKDEKYDALFTAWRA